LLKQSAIEINSGVFLMWDRDRRAKRRKDKLGEVFGAAALVKAYCE
jgi:hypothetical protein